MEILLLLIYSVFVWLVFFKFKLLPWNLTSQVIVITLPIVALAILMLLLNIVAPVTNDVRVINYVVQIVPRVTGRVIEVPVEPNQPVKKGAVLFRLDPTPFEQQVRNLEAKLVDAEAYQRELEAQLRSAQGKKAAVASKLKLARLRAGQTKELAETGAGSRFDYEQAGSEEENLAAELNAATAAETEVRQKLAAQTPDGELAEVAQTRAQLDQALWELSQTVVYAPADGSVINLQLRPGSYAAALPISPVMSFVENEQWVLALYGQNELREVKAGDEAEIALKNYPNRIIKCEVSSIVWATGQGQLPLSGMIPQAGTAPVPPGRFAVRMIPTGKDKDVFLPAGARGQGAVYTQSLEIIHIIRKVLLRVATKLDWVIVKHLSLPSH